MGSSVRPRPRSPELDAGGVGVSFVDLLFALAVAKSFDALARFSAIGWAGRWHFFLAVVLTVTSWVGYHMSRSRPRWSIHFFNLPLLVFCVDIVLVALYWLAALYVDGTSDLARTDSALPEAVIVAAVFLLYIVWDHVTLLIHRSPAYRHAYKEALHDDMPVDDGRRRAATAACWAVAVAILAVAWRWSNPGETGIVAIDAALVALLIVYRVVKE